MGVKLLMVRLIVLGQEMSEFMEDHLLKIAGEEKPLMGTLWRFVIVYLTRGAITYNRCVDAALLRTV